LLSDATPARPSRTGWYAGLGVAVLGTAALIGTVAMVNTATDTVVDMASGSAAPLVTTVDLTPELADIRLPAAPPGCSPAALADRDAQATALRDQQNAELQAISSTDALALGAVRDRAGVALNRISMIDAECVAAAAG
jgi:hypothetical protein